MFVSKVYILLYIANIFHCLVESQDAGYTESAVPGQPTILHVEASSVSIVVSWSPPQEQNIPIQGFILGYGGVPDTYIKFLNADERNYTITNLSE